MNFKLTSKYKHSQKDGGGKSKNIIQYFLNGTPIYKQRVPYDEDFEPGFQNRTRLYDLLDE